MLRSVAFFLFLTALASAGCPSGSIYDSYFDKCYKFVSTPKSFLDAEVYCNSLGGHLADQTNAFESSYMAGMASGASSQTPNFWIGANLLRSSNWTWTSNASMGYTNWAPGQPNSASPCAYVKDTSATWMTLPCNSLLPFMCKISPNAAQQETCPTQPPSPTCASDTCAYDSYCTDGYTLYTRNCLCYKYFNSTYLSFSDANATCAKNGGILASIPSKDVNDFLTVLPGFNCYANSCPWIGLSCPTDSVSNCYWADGTPLGNYSNIDYIFRNGLNYALVSVISLTSFDDGKWGSVPGDRAYLCQKEKLRLPCAVRRPSYAEFHSFKCNGRIRSKRQQFVCVK